MNSVAKFRILSGALSAWALSVSVAALAQEAPQPFVFPESCKSGLQVEILIPCADKARAERYQGKNVGLSFSGVGSFTMPAFDQVGYNGYDLDTCLASFTLKDSQKIARVLKGELTPHATVAPGNGQWDHYSGLAVGKTPSEGSKASSTVKTDGERCEVSFSMDEPRTGADQHAATQQCLSEYKKDHFLKNGAKGTWATTGKPTDAGSMEGACKTAVANVANLSGASPVVCVKALGPGEQADPSKGEDVIHCRDQQQGVKQSAIVIKTGNGGTVVGEAQPVVDLKKPVAASAGLEDDEPFVPTNENF